MTLDYNKMWTSLNELESVTSKICSAREILDSAIDALENHKKDKAEALMYAADEYLKYYLEEFDSKFKDVWKETVVKLHKEDKDHLNAVLREKEYYEPSMPPWGHSDLEYLANDILTKDRNSNFPGENTIWDKDDTLSECSGAWNSFWEENYYPEEYKGSTVSSVNDTMASWGYSDKEPLRYTDEEMNAMCDKAASDEKHSKSYYDYTRNDSNRPNPFDKVVKWQLPVEELENGDTGEQEYFITFPDDLLEAANLSPGDEVEWVDRNDGSFLLQKVTKPLGMDEC
jgi:hypothetical protein